MCSLALNCKHELIDGDQNLGHGAHLIEALSTVSKEDYKQSSSNHYMKRARMHITDDECACTADKLKLFRVGPVFCVKLLCDSILKPFTPRLFTPV